MALVVQNTKKLQYNRNEFFFFLKIYSQESFNNLSTRYCNDYFPQLNKPLGYPPQKK